MLTLEQGISVLKGLRGLGIAIAEDAPGGIVGAAVAVTLAVKKIVDSDNDKLLQKTELDEGCRHITMIDGWTQPFNDMIYHLSQNGGTSWKNGDGNSHWYYHEQDDFDPSSVTDGYRTPRLVRFTTGKGASKCAKCAKEAQARRVRSGS